MSAQTTPLSFMGGWASNIVVAPFAYVATGTPISGAGSANGGLATKSVVGADINLTKLLGGQFAVGGYYGYRTGSDVYSGPFVGAEARLTWRF